jgi:hypothetical protein
MRTIRWIVISSSETADKSGQPVDVSVEQLRQHHQTHNGWDDTDAHFLVRFSGAVETGRDLATVGAHVGGYETEAIVICVAGHGDLQPFRLTQRSALGQLCARLCRQFALSPLRVVGRRESDAHGAPAFPTTSPGKLVDMAIIRADVARALLSPEPTLRELKHATSLRPPPVQDHAEAPAVSRTFSDRLDQLEQRIIAIETLLDVA